MWHVRHCGRCAPPNGVQTSLCAITYLKQKGWWAESLRHEQSASTPLPLHVTAHHNSTVPWYDEPTRVADTPLAHLLPLALYNKLLTALRHSKEQGPLWMHQLATEAGTELGTEDRISQALQTRPVQLKPLMPALKAALTTDGMTLAHPVEPATGMGVRVHVHKDEWVATSAVANVVQMGLVVSDPVIVQGTPMVDVQLVGEVSRAAAGRI